MGIRRLVEARLAEIHANDSEQAAKLQQRHLQHMASAEIAPLPHKANEQHYEVPAAFFAKVLGPHRKYSSCYWGTGI
ncbi:MAG: SAM-dependent methyltransferase, partial [Burkholderiales bacterium]|nr:SAM-dependent methyltransferase [Burkholderiales bacterium]